MYAPTSNSSKEIGFYNNIIQIINTKKTNYIFNENIGTKKDGEYSVGRLQEGRGMKEAKKDTYKMASMNTIL